MEVLSASTRITEKRITRRKVARREEETRDVASKSTGAELRFTTLCRGGQREEEERAFLCTTRRSVLVRAYVYLCVYPYASRCVTCFSLFLSPSLSLSLSSAYTFRLWNSKQTTLFRSYRKLFIYDRLSRVLFLRKTNRKQEVASLTNTVTRK